MIYRRLRRFEEKKQRKRLMLSLIGIIGILTLILVFGLRLLVTFSLFVDKVRGNSPQTQTQTTILLPPTLDPLPEATNSATLTISGTGQSGLTLVLYKNEAEVKQQPISPEGIFSIPSLSLDEGDNTISAKVKDDKGNVSDLSNVIRITIRRNPPDLDVSSPQNGVAVNGEKKSVTVAGKVKEDTTVTINGRYAVVLNDGSFSYDFPLNDGDNFLKITAADVAGNQTTVERKVTYSK